MKFKVEYCKGNIDYENVINANNADEALYLYSKWLSIKYKPSDKDYFDKEHINACYIREIDTSKDDINKQYIEFAKKKVTDYYYIYKDSFNFNHYIHSKKSLMIETKFPYNVAVVDVSIGIDDIGDYNCIDTVYMESDDWVFSPSTKDEFDKAFGEALTVLTKCKFDINEA